jgi:selenocysteine-specific elongation factor
LLDQLRGLFANGEGLTVSQLKDHLGITRKYAIPLCEHLDRRGYTRRSGDFRYAGENL